MRRVLSVLVAVHAVIHILGFVKAFGITSIDSLRVPISRPMGLVWLLATMLLLGAAGSLLVDRRWFWLVGGVGLVVSQIAVAASWSDARFGTIPNAILLGAVVYGAFAWGPFGLRGEYRRLVGDEIAQTTGLARPSAITEADLANLPGAVQRYLRFSGVVGTPRVFGFRARMVGRIRGSAEAPWMSFRAEQYNFLNPSRRYFFMEATRTGLPIDGLHVYGESDAGMRVRLLSLVPVVNVHGPQMMRAETVTILNDMCIFAPASLLSPDIRWRELDSNKVEATYTAGAHTIRAVLEFDETGALADFWSNDRPALTEDGKTMTPQRWSTPIHAHRTMGPYRLASRGEARYAPESGEYAYIEFDDIEVDINFASSELVKKSGDGLGPRILRPIGFEKPESYREYGAGFVGAKGAKSSRSRPVQLFFTSSLRTILMRSSSSIGTDLRRIVTTPAVTYTAFASDLPPFGLTPDESEYRCKNEDLCEIRGDCLEYLDEKPCCCVGSYVIGMVVSRRGRQTRVGH